MENNIRTAPFTPDYADGLRALDEQIYREILYHADVVPDSAFLAFSGENVCGAGYLLAAPGDRLHLTFQTDTESAAGVYAAEALITRLRTLFRQMQEKKPELMLCVWCKEKARAYRSFLEYFGFRKRARMLTMVKALPGAAGGSAEEIIRAEAAFRICSPDLTDPAQMREYMRVNEESFSVPDSERELSFRVRYCGAKVYAAVRDGNVPEKAGPSEKMRADDALIAAVTTWPVTESRAATENIFCAEKYRRRGVTSALLSRVHRELIKEGFTEAVLNVYEDDLPAVRMYEKLGYRTEGKLLELSM